MSVVCSYILNVLNIKQIVCYTAIRCPPMESPTYVERSGPEQCCIHADGLCHNRIAVPCLVLLSFPSQLRSQVCNHAVRCCAPMQGSWICPLCNEHQGCPGENQNSVRTVKSWSSSFIFPFLQSFPTVSDSICTPQSRRKFIGVWLVFEEINTQFHPRSLLWKLLKQRQNKWQCLGSSGIYSTKMKATLWGLVPNRSKASYVAAVGCWWWLCPPVLFSDGRNWGVAGCLVRVCEVGKHRSILLLRH